MRYIKLFEDFNKISIFDNKKWQELLPKSITLITSSGEWALELSDTNVIGASNLLQITYHQNTPDEENGDVLADGEPDFLEFDIHIMKDNDGTEANPDKLRLNIDITYGDAMASEFTIDQPNTVRVHHYTGINSLHDPETVFAFTDDTIKDLVDFFNRFTDRYELTPKNFAHLDKDPNSFDPKIGIIPRD